MRREHAKLTAEVAALREERATITAAIDAVQLDGIAKVRAVADTAAEVKRAAAEFARVTAEAAELGRAVAFAQALRAADPAVWARVTAEEWEAVLRRLAQWSEVNALDPEVPLPADLRKQVEDQAKYPSLYGQVRLSLRALLAWLRAGLIAADEQRTALAAGSVGGDDAGYGPRAAGHREWPRLTPDPNRL